MMKHLRILLLCLVPLGLLSCSDDDNPPQPVPIVLQGCEILCDGPGCPTSCDDIAFSQNFD